MIRVCGCGRARYPEAPATTAPQAAVTSSAMAPRTLSVSGGGSMCEQIIQVTIVPRAPPTADPPEAASTLLVGALDGTCQWHPPSPARSFRLQQPCRSPFLRLLQ